MALRFYLCRWIGDGSDDAPYRPALSQYAGSVAVCDGGGRGEQDLSLAWARIEDAAHESALADPGITPLPIEGDALAADLSASEQGHIEEILAGCGISVGRHSTPRGYLCELRAALMARLSGRPRSELMVEIGY